MAIAELDKTTIKQITTTQVITSVYSAVKELVENALDSGAIGVDVYLEDKGLSLIEVKDNGKGISKVDSVCMALASYTSKISNMTDLESLESYGFRGEALNALCKVADVQIITRTLEDDNHARCYTLSGDGTIEKAEFCNRAIGTTVQIRSLFKKFPVRRQIISNKKQANEDVKLVENLLKEFGICRPALRINYRVDSATVFSKIPADTEETNLGHVFGRKFAIQYNWLSFSDSELKIGLTIPKRDLSDLSTISQLNYQHIFVNGRPVIFKEFEKPIVKLYSAHFGDKISSRKKPPFFLSITTSPSLVDVNLEPNKTSVLLVNQASIIEIVTNLLADYYQVTVEAPAASSDRSQLLDESSSVLSVSLSALNDSTSPETEADVKPPSPKKRKIDRGKVNLNTDNKENAISNGEMTSGLLPREKAPVSQLPEVNMGEDFSTQEISALPTLSAEQVEAVENNLRLSNTSNASSEGKQSMQMTASQWSKGQSPVTLVGGTDVSIVNLQTVNKPSTSTNPEANKSGFLKYSKEMRPRIIKNNPDMNLVQIAQSLTEQWKQLSSDEREHYRELGMLDETITRTKLSPSPARKIPKPKDAVANKKRLLNMLENMKDQKSDKKGNVPAKTFVPWEITRHSLLQSFQNLGRNKSNDLLVGSIDGKVWITKTKMELWCLDVDKLFAGLHLNDYECKKIPEFIEQSLQRWLVEKDSMDLMHTIFDYSELKDN